MPAWSVSPSHKEMPKATTSSVLATCGIQAFPHLSLHILGSHEALEPMKFQLLGRCFFPTKRSHKDFSYLLTWWMSVVFSSHSGNYVVFIVCLVSRGCKATFLWTSRHSNEPIGQLKAENMLFFWDRRPKFGSQLCSLLAVTLGKLL